jgi:hypothetical protein
MQSTLIRYCIWFKIRATVPFDSIKSEIRSRDNSVGTATDYWLGGRGVGVRFPVREIILSLVFSV